MRGPPLVPVRAIPVDMFPHTKLCELVLYFERINVNQLGSETTNEAEKSARDMQTESASVDAENNAQEDSLVAEKNAEEDTSVADSVSVDL